MVEIKEEFRIRLDKALEINDMKPADLARLSGISEATISQYRSGYSKPKDERLVRIANILHVDPSWLMGLDVPMRRNQGINADGKGDDPDDERFFTLFSRLTYSEKQELLNYIMYILSKRQS